MKKIILSTLPLLTMVYGTNYQLTHLKKGASLNVREVPIISSHTVVGKLPSNATGIIIKLCKYNKNGQEWCYINYPVGGYHLEGWVKRHFLKKMKESQEISKIHITNFLHNFYMADEENFLDKLQVFYVYPMQQYMNSRNLSLMDLRNRKVNFYKMWPKREYRFSYLTILRRRAEYIDVQTTVRWHIQNRENELFGKDIQKIRLIPENSSFKILAIKNLKHIIFPKEEIVVEEPKVEPLPNDEKTPPQEEKSPKNRMENSTIERESTNLSNSLSTYYYIQVGSFYGKIKPSYLRNISKNRLPYMIQKVKQNNAIIQRVLVGPFKTTQQAKKMLVIVRKSISKNAYIQTIKR